MREEQPRVVLTKDDINYLRGLIPSGPSTQGLRRLYGVLLFWDSFPVMTIYTERYEQNPALRPEDV